MTSLRPENFPHHIASSKAINIPATAEQARRPAGQRLLKGLPRGRLQLDGATISRCVRAALSAGWEPTTRGKPVMFTVDAEGN